MGNITEVFGSGKEKGIEFEDALFDKPMLKKLLQKK